MSDYAYPHSLATTQWVAEHLNDSNVRLLEVGWGISEFDAGHIPGAIAVWIYADIHRDHEREIPSKSEIEEMLSKAGIANQDTIVLYGGFGNLIAALAFWVLKIYGHRDVRLLDGGRQKWLAEGRPLSTEIPSPQATQYVALEPDIKLRADKDFIIGVIGKPEYVLVDARPEDMYSGENTAGVARGGHIATAINLPAARILDDQGGFVGWQTPSTNSDGTFKSFDELQKLFLEKNIAPGKTIITYCLRGGLSTHLWFVLTQLLGYSHVSEYDRSWLEWGTRADTPVER